MTYKLISYNMWHGMHFDKVVEFLKSEKADIICLQEVGTIGKAMKASSENMFETIKEELGFQAIFSEMFCSDLGQGVYNMGVAVLSRFPIVSHEEFIYERERTDIVFEPAVKDRYYLPRVLLDVDLDINGTILKVVTTHMTITVDAQVSDHQLKSLNQVKDYLKSYDDYLLCGDMNLPYGKESYQVISEGFEDWSLPEQPSLHPTIHKIGEMGYHVDYVFYKGSKLKHVGSQVPVVDASDHLPVVVEFEL